MSGHFFRENSKKRPKAEEERFLETYPPVGIAGSRKIIALGGDDESLEYGYGILLTALDWSLKKHPENAKEIELLAEELQKIDKFPEIRNNARFYLFYHRSRPLDRQPEFPLPPVAWAETIQRNAETERTG